MSYAAAKATSRRRHLFGKGSIDGLMAAETGDMSSIPGHIIPALALGIPGSAPSAVLMAAMIIHGIQPGPMLMIEHPQFVYDVVAMTSLATVSILVFGLFLVRPLLLVLRIKRTVLMPIIFLLCTVGAYASASRLFDVYCHAGGWHRRLLPAPARLPDGAVRAGAGAGGSCSTRVCAAAWCCRTAASRPSSPGRSARRSRSCIFTLLLYVPPFKAAVRRVTGGFGAIVRAPFRRAPRDGDAA